MAFVRRFGTHVNETFTIRFNSFRNHPLVSAHSSGLTCSNILLLNRIEAINQLSQRGWKISAASLSLGFGDSARIT